jgi:hypothetical protein
VNVKQFIDLPTPFDHDDALKQAAMRGLRVLDIWELVDFWHNDVDFMDSAKGKCFWSASITPYHADSAWYFNADDGCVGLAGRQSLKVVRCVKAI